MSCNYKTTSTNERPDYSPPAKLSCSRKFWESVLGPIDDHLISNQTLTFLLSSKKLCTRSLQYLLEYPDMIDNLFLSIEYDLRLIQENPQTNQRTEVEHTYINFVYFAIVNNYTIDWIKVSNLFQFINEKTERYYCIAGHLLKIDLDQQLLPSIEQLNEIFTIYLLDAPPWVINDFIFELLRASLDPQFFVVSQFWVNNNDPLTIQLLLLIHLEMLAISPQLAPRDIIVNCLLKRSQALQTDPFLVPLTHFLIAELFLLFLDTQKFSFIHEFVLLLGHRSAVIH